MLGSDQVTVIELKDTAVAMTLVGAEGAIKTKLNELIRSFLRGGGGGVWCKRSVDDWVPYTSGKEWFTLYTCFVGLDCDWVTWLTDTSSSECMYDDGVVCEWIQVC